MRKHIYLALSCSLCWVLGHAQVSSDKPVDTGSPEVEKVAESPSESDARSKNGKKERVKERYRFMANVHGGVGINRFFGDVIDSDKIAVHTLGNRPMFNFGIGANVTNYLELNIDGVYGWLNGNENHYGAHRNFEAEMFGVGANLVYNFHNVLRSPVGITPFISIGASYTDYKVYSDLVDGQGNTYYYWDDQTIRSVEQGLEFNPNAPIIERDFDYETRINQSPLTAVSIPVGVGLDFNASRKIAVRLGATYCFTTTDLIDNAASGENGFFSNDGFLTTQLSFIYRFDPFKKKAPVIEVEEGDYGNFSELESVDSDGDGVADFMDQCSGTPKGIPVDAKGCPFDRDNDAIPDFRDKQLNTPPGAIVNPDGVAISYQEIYQKFGEDTSSIKRKEATPELIFSQKDKNPSYTVHLGTYVNDDIPTQLKKKLTAMPGLVERKINDSTSVFTVGVYKDFADAEAKQNELREKGVMEAFGVSDKAVVKVSQDIEKLGTAETEGTPRAIAETVEEKDVLSFGVELREYRLRIELDKLSRLIAQYGVEMKVTAGGLKLYTIGSFKTYDEAVKLQQEVMTLGVKDTGIAAKFNNKPIEIKKAREMEAELSK